MPPIAEKLIEFIGSRCLGSNLANSVSKKKILSIEAQELKALKKELRDVTMERDILKKAVSIFSKSDQ